MAQRQNHFKLAEKLKIHGAACGVDPSTKLWDHVRYNKVRKFIMLTLIGDWWNFIVGVGDIKIRKFLVMWKVEDKA